MASKPIGSFYVQLGLNTKEFQKNLKNAERDLKNTFGSAAIRTSQALAVSMAALAGAVAAVGAASVKLAADYEVQQKSFERMLGSAEAANKKLKELQDFAARTPFTFTELTDYTKSLLALGFTADQVKPTLTTLGDAASGLGLGAEGMGRLIKAFGDIRAKGVLSTQEIKQLAEAGIPAFEILAQKIGVSIPEAMKLVEDRAISSTVALTAFTTGMNEKFGGMMAIQSETTLGLWSSVRDETENIMRQIGSEINKSTGLQNMVRGLRDSLSSLRMEVYEKGVLQAFTDLFGPKMKTMIVGLAAAITGALIPALKSLVISITASTAGLIKLAGLYGAVAAGAYFVIQQIDKALGKEDPLKNMSLEQLQGLFQQQRDKYLKAASQLDRLKDPSNSFLRAGTDTITTQIMAAETQMQGELAELKKIEGALKFVEERQRKGLEEVKDYFNNTDFGNLTDPFTSFYKNLSGQGRLSSIPSFKTPGIDTSGTKSAVNKLAEDAKALSESIEADWIAATKTKQEQLEYEYQKELEKLQKSKAANENYLRDLQRMTEVYSKRGLDLEQERLEKIRQDKVAIAESEYTYLQQQIEDEAAANNTRYENHVRHLEEKDAAYRAHLEGQRNLTEIQNQLLADANRTSASYMAEGYRTLYYGLSDAFTNIITGAKSAGEAFKQLGIQLIQMVVRWMVQRKLAAVMSKSLEASQTAASVAQAAAISAAWAPAAAMVAAATFGASTAAAGAGLTGLSVLSRSLAMPGLAEGGIVTKPTLAWVGEGKESEAVIPLSRLENMVGSGGGVQINVVNNSGMPVQAKASQRMDGGKTVVELFIDGYTRNVGGIQDIIGGR